MDWDDARFFLAVLRAGTLSGAARQLDCSHSTVRRRLAGLEEAVGVTLFVASSDGLVATDAAREATPLAESIESAALAFGRQLTGQSERLTGRIVITTIDVLAEWLAPAIERFAQAHPEVDLELLTDNRHLDLSRREADIALRATNQPPDHLFGRRVGRLDFAPFAAPSLVERYQGRLKEMPWVLFTRQSRATLTERWYQGWAGDKAPLVRVSNGGAVLALVRAGIAGALVAEALVKPGELVQLEEAIDGLSVDLWCLTHYDLRHSARIRALMKAMAE